MTNPRRLSFLFIAGTLLVTAWLHLATPFVAALFSYLALEKIHSVKKKWKGLTVTVFLVVLATIAYGLGYITREAVRVLPAVADQAIPSVLELAKKNNIELPFTDYDSLKEVGFDAVKAQVGYISSAAKFAKGATTQFLYLLVGLVVALGLFLNPRMELQRHRHAIRNNLYSMCCDEIAKRFSTLYQSFETVMGAQIIISAINAAFTGVFVLIVHLPYSELVVGITFLCGLLPVVGNLISNTVIVGIGFTVSPRMGMIALIFLIVIHKLEYFLNSKIVGHRIKNPLWLTLVGLIIGERLLGIPGMILAPVILNYIKVEASAVEVPDDEPRRSKRHEIDDGKGSRPTLAEVPEEKGPLQ